MNSPNKFGFEVDGSSAPPIISIPNNPVYSTPVYSNTPDFSNPPPNPQSFSLPSIQSAGSLSKLTSLRKKIKVIKWSLIPLALMQLLFILPQAYPLLLTIVFQLIGLIGILKISSYFVKLFGIYLIMLVVVQVITMIVLRGTAYVVIQTLFILFEIFCAFLSLRTAREMDQMSNADLENLKS